MVLKSGYDPRLSGREKYRSLFERSFTVKVEEFENAELQLEFLDLRLTKVQRDVYQEQPCLVLFVVAGRNTSSSFEKRSFLDNST